MHAADADLSRAASGTSGFVQLRQARPNTYIPLLSDSPLEFLNTALPLSNNRSNKNASTRRLSSATRLRHRPLQRDAAHPMIALFADVKQGARGVEGKE